MYQSNALPNETVPSSTSTNDELLESDFRPPIDEVFDRSKDLGVEQKALELKQEGNGFLLKGRYLDAVRLYSEALEYTPTNAIILSNRAQAYNKLENYGSAIVDADAAILLDQSYAKGYYRRASARFALNKVKLARKDFRQVCKLKPKDRDARSKLAECDKAIKEEAFAAAIMSDLSEPLSATYDPNTISIDTNYDGPHPLDVGLTNDMKVEGALFESGKLPLAFVMVNIFLILLLRHPIVSQMPPLYFYRQGFCRTFQKSESNSSPLCCPSFDLL